MAEELKEQERVRREKLAKLEAVNVLPFGEKFNRTDSSKTVKEKAEGKGR